MTSQEKVYIEQRQRRLVNTDPQRRCYNGCHYKSESVWGPWEHLETTAHEHLENRLEAWRRLDAYAVSQRGEGARTEFRMKEGAK